MRLKLSRFLQIPDSTHPARLARTARFPAGGQVEGFTLEQIQAACTRALWQQIRDDSAALQEFVREYQSELDSLDPAAREACRRDLEDQVQINRGQRPERFGSTAVCRHCGLVYVPVWLEGRDLVGCCWCAIRQLGLEIPRPDNHGEESG